VPDYGKKGCGCKLELHAQLKDIHPLWLAIALPQLLRPAKIKNLTPCIAGGQLKLYLV